MNDVSTPVSLVLAAVVAVGFGTVTVATRGGGDGVDDPARTPAAATRTTEGRLATGGTRGPVGTPTTPSSAVPVVDHVLVPPTTTASPTAAPSGEPTTGPTTAPTADPTADPTDDPSSGPTDAPTDGPTATPTDGPGDVPTDPATAPATPPATDPEVEVPTTPAEPAPSSEPAPTAPTTPEQPVTGTPDPSEPSGVPTGAV